MKKDLPKNTVDNGRDVKGRFTDGNKGKPKGATNTTTRELREFITNFLNDKAFEIPHIWDALDDRDKLTLFMHLCKLVLPKPNIEPSTKDNIQRFDFDVNIVTPLSFFNTDENNEIND